MALKYSKKRFILFLGLSLIATASVLFYICTIQSCSFSRNTTRDNWAEQSSGRKWAEPISLPGLPNLHKVSENLYRGAQPTEEGFENLKKLGIKTIVNLRDLHSDKNKITDSNLGYEQIDMLPWHPKDEDVIRFLQTVSDKSKQPVFVHCRYGSDRTGVMCAVYRIVIEGWSKQQAIDEMTNGGFGFHPAWQNLISYIQNVDPNTL
jgi:protein tyrosine/serine phosphatase